VRDRVAVNVAETVSFHVGGDGVSVKVPRDRLWVMLKVESLRVNDSVTVIWGVGESVPLGLSLVVDVGVLVGVLVWEPGDKLGVVDGVPVAVKEALHVGDTDCVVTDTVQTVGVLVGDGLEVVVIDLVLRVACVAVWEKALLLCVNVEPVSVAEREGAVCDTVGGERVNDSVKLMEAEGVKLGEGVGREMDCEQVGLKETDRTRLGVPEDVGENEIEGAGDAVSDSDMDQLNGECVRVDTVLDAVQNSVADLVDVGVTVALPGDTVRRNESVKLSVGDATVTELRDCESEGVLVSVGEGSVGLGESETEGARDRLCVNDVVSVGLEDGEGMSDAESVWEDVREVEIVGLNDCVARCVGGDQDEEGLQDSERVRVPVLEGLGLALRDGVSDGLWENVGLQCNDSVSVTER